MARRVRIEYPGACYCVSSRGHRHDIIFRDDRDRKCFIEALGGMCAKTAITVSAYCLLPNQFLLVLATPRANLGEGMKFLLGTYTGYFNRRHRTCGPLFSGRYKALLIDEQHDGYLRSMCDYVHLRPVCEHLVEEDELLSVYRWSSYPELLKPRSQRVAWLKAYTVMGKGILYRDNTAGRRQFERATEQLRSRNERPEWKQAQRCWCVGGKRFRQRLLSQVAESRRGSHKGAAIRAMEDLCAERIVKVELKGLQLKEADLQLLPKGEKRKILVADRLRSETMVTHAWIANRLCMGSPNYLRNRLYLFRNGRIV